MELLPNGPGGFKTAQGEPIEIPDPLGLGPPITDHRGEFPIGTRRISQVGYINVKTGSTAAPVWENEARLVLERHLGRRLRDDETAHRKPGVPRYDNRLEGLELWRRGRPVRMKRPPAKRTNWKGLYLEAIDVVTLLLPYAKQKGHELDDETAAAIKRVLERRPTP